MNITITDDCISCEKCVEICPDVFEMGDNIAQVKINASPEEHQDAVHQAADECPVDAIIVE